MEQGQQTTHQQQRFAEYMMKASRYKVIMHNDDVTTMDFVVQVLQEVFYKKAADAEQIMLQIHHFGSAVVGVYTYDVAKTKIQRVEMLARIEGFPLRLTMQPAD